MKYTPAPVPATVPKSSLATVAKNGFAWGAGNAVAHVMVNSLFSKVELPAVPEAYVQCMKDFEDKEACKHLLKQNNSYNNNSSHSF